MAVSISPVGGRQAARREPTPDAPKRPVWSRAAVLAPALREPGPWIGVLVMMMLVIVVWQHPIARVLGTESPAPAPVVVSTLPQLGLPAPATAQVDSRHRPKGHQIHHSPRRNPFRPLLTAPVTTPVTGVSGPVTTVPSASSPTTPVGHHPRGDGAGAIPAPPVVQPPEAGQHHNALQPPAAVVPLTAIGPPKTVLAPTTTSPHHSVPPSGTGGCATTYVVTAGQSLWSIAHDHLMTQYSSVDKAWHQLYQANRATIGSNPGFITVGERLCAPSSGRQ